ncbi:alpha/beta fold hydrolase [Streptomyces sp. NPDC056352]|uniref:alpha/beta fold hydrolase n=1 Tax=Streptomyces sp. NPDC056352 TaxID=3345791 RepID=UPI0035DF2A86
MLTDLDETLAARGITGPVVPVGHSLGGMLAALYAAERPGRVRGAVDRDGFRWGRPAQHPGLDPGPVARHPADIGAMSRASAGRRMPAEYVQQEGRRTGPSASSRQHPPLSPPRPPQPAPAPPPRSGPGPAARLSPRPGP